MHVNLHREICLMSYCHSNFAERRRFMILNSANIQLSTPNYSWRIIHVIINIINYWLFCRSSTCRWWTIYID